MDKKISKKNVKVSFLYLVTLSPNKIKRKKMFPMKDHSTGEVLYLLSFRYFDRVTAGARMIGNCCSMIEILFSSRE